VGIGGAVSILGGYFTFPVAVLIGAGIVTAGVFSYFVPHFKKFVNWIRK